MANVKRGLFRIYIVLASVLSSITILVTINAVQTLNKSSQEIAGGLQAEFVWTALITILLIWGLLPVGYLAIRWIIQGFRSRG